MNALPSGVQSSLVDAGFSPTEVVILLRLVQDDALTLREIAARCGKSTGVLDQATKKLLQKNIIRKEIINNSVKFAITSLDAVLRWMEEDGHRKRELLARRHQNFESFIRTLEHSKRRPEIEYFHGIDGLATAYRKLLNCGKEILGYVPVFCSIEDHPLRDFLVEWFRNRRKRGIFSRIIAHNTPLGRRYQTRDAFEYRQTILVEETEYPFTFEKIICGDTVACFNYTEKRACLLRYPELAEMERSLFDSLWRQLKNPPLPLSSAIPNAAAQTAAALEPVSGSPVPFRIRTLSGLREFFVSKKSIAAFCGIAVLSAVLTFALYSYTKRLQFRQMQETVKSIAITAALQFKSEDLAALQMENDWEKPEWTKIVEQLVQIRTKNRDIRYTYIFRKLKNDPSALEFVADSHSLNPYANIDDDPNNDVDLDGNGKIEPSMTGGDYLAWPGQPYPSPPKETFIAYNGPIANEQFYEDQWGKVITGYAPIKDDEGNVSAILGIDMNAKLLNERVSAIFKPILYFFGFFLIFAFIRLAAFNKSLLTELLQAFQIRKIIILLLLVALLSAIVTFCFYAYTKNLQFRQMQQTVKSIAASAVFQFDPNDLDELQVEEDWKKPEWGKVVKQLQKIRMNNEDIIFVYMFRKSKSDPGKLEFIADSHSLNPYANVDEDSSNNIDADENGIIEPKGPDLLQWPGQLYPETPKEAFIGFEQPIASNEFYEDQWGKVVTGYAPIKNNEGKTIAELAIDMKSKVLESRTSEIANPLLSFLGLFVILIILHLVTYNRPVIKRK